MEARVALSGPDLGDRRVAEHQHWARQEGLASQSVSTPTQGVRLPTMVDLLQAPFSRAGLRHIWDYQGVGRHPLPVPLGLVDPSQGSGVFPVVSLSKQIDAIRILAHEPSQVSQIPGSVRTSLIQKHWAKTVDGSLKPTSTGLELLVDMSSPEWKPVLASFRSLGLPFTTKPRIVCPYEMGSTWNGRFHLRGLTPRQAVHELAHWFVATPTQRDWQNFGLGPHPARPEDHTRARLQPRYHAAVEHRANVLTAHLCVMLGVG